MRQLPRPLPRPRGRIERGGVGAILLLVALAAACATRPPPVAAEGSAERGATVFRAANCYSCHTDIEGEGRPLAGGRALDTPFGTFHTPNITPDPEHGLGEWSEADFIRAMREGVSPDGSPYYPAFPYTSYAGMTDQDVRDLWAYLQEQEPVAEPNRAHELDFPFGMRFLLHGWQLMFFEPERFSPDEARSESWNRGAYLVRVLGHCGECHTPRNVMGAKEEDRALSGNPEGPEGKEVPDITRSGIEDWSQSDIVFLLEIGLKPDGDVVSGPMGEVVEYSTSHLSEEDRQAIAEYLLDPPGSQ